MPARWKTIDEQEQCRNRERICERDDYERNDSGCKLTIGGWHLTEEQRPRGRPHEDRHDGKDADDGDGSVNLQWALTCDMSGGPEGAQRTLRRPLDGGVRQRRPGALRHGCQCQPPCLGAQAKKRAASVDHTCVGWHRPWISASACSSASSGSTTLSVCNELPSLPNVRHERRPRGRAADSGTTARWRC